MFKKYEAYFACLRLLSPTVSNNNDIFDFNFRYHYDKDNYYLFYYYYHYCYYCYYFSFSYFLIRGFLFTDSVFYRSSSLQPSDDFCFIGPKHCIDSCIRPPQTFLLPLELRVLSKKERCTLTPQFLQVQLFSLSCYKTLRHAFLWPYELKHLVS